jgi:rhamnose utilization protein RhaD (predicted bifunctional aldolase and dehydrogenase)
MSNLVTQLTELAKVTGAPEADLTIVAEGNIAVLEPGTNRFLVKASGVVMGNATEDDWVYLDLDKCAQILIDADKKGVTDKLDKAFDAILKESVTPNGKVRKASIETMVHVVAFHLMGATWSLHTHPTPVVALAASKDAAKHYSGTVFPDEAVVCGPVPLFLPYESPGLSLGLGVYQGVEKYQDKYGRSPGQIILGNHGLCTFGSVSSEALSTTQIAVKAAKVRVGALSSGGINFIPKKAAEAIAFRPDEILRRKMLSEQKKS